MCPPISDLALLLFVSWHVSVSDPSFVSHFPDEVRGFGDEDPVKSVFTFVYLVVCFELG